MVFGAWNLHARMIGLCCACLLGCVNFAALITTAVFRFNSMGQLASLSLAPTYYTGDSSTDPPYLSDKRSYSGDARMILAVWIMQLFACLCSCCFSIFINKPPSKEEIALRTNIVAHDVEESDLMISSQLD
mmetsp:Transcript_8074/g.9289  ORF Transcript_8074/g.9289 Transcript_8074/m.9289 type:complete len:131 (-) Transcript_8074:71-463(-)